MKKLMFFENNNSTHVDIWRSVLSFNSLAGVAGSVAQTVLGFVFFVMLRICITKNTSCGTRLVSSAAPSLWISHFAA